MKLFYEDLKGDGAIINLASSSALRPDSSGYGAYAAVKEAIRSLTRAAAVEWGKDNIRVNTIMPQQTLLACSGGLMRGLKKLMNSLKRFLLRELVIVKMILESQFVSLSQME